MMLVFDLFEKRLEPGVLTWRVDNSSALFAIINQGRTRSWNLSWLAMQIVEKAHSMGMTIAPIQVSLEENLLADGASRNVQIANWWLKQSVAEKVRGHYGRPDVNLMATTLSRKAPFFYSWNCQDTEVLAINSLAPDISWVDWELPYVFPPFPLIAPVLAKVLDQKVKVILIVVPWWPSKAFLAMLQSMIFDCRRIRLSRDMITDIVSGLPHPHLIIILSSYRLYLNIMYLTIILLNI